MPDWVTHIVIALLFAEAFDVPKKSIVLFGAILPDIFPKLVLLRLFTPLPLGDLGFLKAFHTPFVLFLVIMLIALLFRYNYLKIVLWLSLGAVTHFFADSLLKHFTGGVNLLFPLSLEHYTLNLVWPNHSFIILIPTILVYFSLLIFKKYSGRRLINNG